MEAAEEKALHFEVIEMRGGTGGKNRGELSKELVELLERVSQTVRLSSSSLKYFMDLKVRISNGFWLCVSL